MEAAWPITIEQAALRLHVKSLRGLKERCRAHGLGRLVGRTIIFDEAEFQTLYRSLPCPSSSSAVKAGPTSMSAAPSEASVASRLQALLTKPPRKRTVRSARRNYTKSPSTESAPSSPSSARL